MKHFITFFLALTALSAGAQVRNMTVYKADGTTVRYDVEGVDSIAFDEIPKWSNRSQEAQKLLAYLEENVGKKILTGTHACVDYNTNEADWVYKHTGKYPAINTIDYIHDIYSSSSSWINYASTTLWRSWTNKGGIMSAMWHWNMAEANEECQDSRPVASFARSTRQLDRGSPRRQLAQGVVLVGHRRAGGLQATLESDVRPLGKPSWPH